MSTDQLRGAIAHADEETRAYVRHALAASGVAAARSVSIFNSLYGSVLAADDDGPPEVSPKIVASVVEQATAVNLTALLLEALAAAADTPELKALFAAVGTELLIAANKAQIAEDQMRAALRDMDTPPSDE
jgi:hypothetical protein